MILPSRRFNSSDEFVEYFLETLTPGIIPRSEFIQWQDIAANLQEYMPALEFYASVENLHNNEPKLLEELRDSYLADDDPKLFLSAALHLLGHTNTKLMTTEDDFDTRQLARQIKNGDETASADFAEALIGLGFPNVLQRTELSDILFGVYVGLESHRRKNLDGASFVNELRVVIAGVVTRLRHEHGYDIKLLEEQFIKYGDGFSKKVDFLILFNDRQCLALEANFYTTIGSKPTEIKRSYGSIRTTLAQRGIYLVWITDGKGCRRMKRSLRDAYVIHPNIYNLHQLQQHFENDLVALIQNEI